MVVLLALVLPLWAVLKVLTKRVYMNNKYVVNPLGPQDIKKQTTLDLNSASDSLTASSLQTLLQRFCNTLSPTCMAMHYMPNSYAKHPVFTLMLRALIQTIYRALLTSAVLGI